MRKALFSLFVATFVLSAIASAETITGVTFQGTPANPTITISGSGFLPEPLGDNDPGGGPFGQDFGDVTTFSLNDGGTFSFTAGEDGDTIGLTDINYTDTLISYQLGLNYATFFQIQYALEQGDPFTVFVNGTGFSGTVDFASSAVPEPSSLALFSTGVLGAFGMARRRFSRS
jgi:PEP-CTERM motif